MRQGVADPASADYLNFEMLLNNIKRISINNGTERALAVALVNAAGGLISSGATSTLSNVADSASSVTLIASNTARLGLFIYNDSTEILYVKFGATASTTSFTLRLTPTGLYEMQSPIYTGVVDGIWAANAAGSARITEITA